MGSESGREGEPARPEELHVPHRIVRAPNTIHLIADNYATHKHPQVQAWFGKHPRFHMHFTPTSASERFFRDLSETQLKRGVFHSVPTW